MRAVYTIGFVAEVATGELVDVGLDSVRRSGVPLPETLVILMPSVLI